MSAQKGRLSRKSSIPSYIIGSDNTVEVDEADLRWRRSSHAAISAMLPSHNAFHSDTGLVLTRQMTEPLKRRSIAQSRKSFAAITRGGGNQFSHWSTIRQFLMGMSAVDALLLGNEDRIQTVDCIKSMTATITVKKNTGKVRNGWDGYWLSSTSFVGAPKTDLILKFFVF